MLACIHDLGDVLLLTNGSVRQSDQHQDLSLVYALIALLVGIIVGWMLPRDPPHRPPPD